MNDLSKERKECIKRAIKQKVADLLAMVDDTAVVRNAQQLFDTEKKFAAITDAIAGHVTEAIVDRSVHDEDLREEGKILVKKAPLRMKKRGERSVEIHPYRGDPFTVDASYYARAGLSGKKADKKGGSTPS